MPRITFGRGSRLAALLAATVLGLALATVASADPQPGRGPSGGPGPAPSPAPGARDCAVLLVQLNGDRPATRTCHVPANGPGTDPMGRVLESEGCYTHDLILYEFTNYGGKRICFRGSGNADLWDYTEFVWSCLCYRSWNDSVSSFKTFGRYVNLYDGPIPHVDSPKLRYAPYQSRASMPTDWNNRVSSICLWGDTWSCP